MGMPIYVPGNPLNVLDVETGILMGLEAMDSFLSFGNKYEFSSLKYPDDIEHFFMHGHYINFFINVQRGSKYYNGETGVYSYKANPYAGSGLAGLIGSSDATFNSIDTSYFGDPLNTVGDNPQDIIQKLTTQRITQAISLYVPDSMSFSTEIEWGDESLTAKGIELLTGALGAAADKMKLGKLTSLLTTAAQFAQTATGMAGFALNPELLVLFRGIGRRQFQYDFFFSPKNEKEAYSIKHIIRSFRFHAAPEINKNYGVFYTAPSTFDIEFMHRGKRNENIHQVKTCVLTNYNVDYAPFGWSTHIDGMPIQTRLSLTFKETQLLTKEDITEGY